MKIAFRADASLKIGTGHVIRCLTLADALKARGAECHFICRMQQGHLADLIGKRGYKVHTLPDSLPSAEPDRNRPPHYAWLEGDWRNDAEETRKVTNALAVDWLVVDHYALDARWEEIAKPPAARLLAIDELADRAHICDALLDITLGRDPADFAALIPSKAKFLSGPRYALLRAEFAAARAAMPPHRAGWLACVGGVDFHNSLGKILDAWEMLGDPKSHLDLVVGGKSPNLAALKARIAGLPDVALHVDVPHLAGLMASAALFVGSAGGIAWECCCLGLPAVMGIAAANQEKNYAALLRARAGFGIDRWQDAEPHRLAAHLERARRHPRLLALVARRAMRLVDGLGAARVANFLLLDTLRLRCATMADALPSLDWRNHEQTRRYFLNPAPISKDVHMDWWRKTLADKNRDLLIAEIGGAAVGVLRLDIDGKGAVIDIYTDPGLDGFGLGATMLRAGKSWAKHERPTLKRLIAEILPENKASRAAFARAGFISQDTKWIAEL